MIQTGSFIERTMRTKLGCVHSWRTCTAGKAGDLGHAQASPSLSLDWSSGNLSAIRKLLLPGGGCVPLITRCLLIRLVVPGIQSDSEQRRKMKNGNRNGKYFILL